MSSVLDVGDERSNPGVRLVEVGRGEASSWGFQLTRGKWDPYPWVGTVETGGVAETAGLKPGDCLLEVNGEDVLGKRVSEVAQVVKSRPDRVSLLLWNAGVDPQCSPEAICCGPMPTNLQRLSACMSTILAFLECPVCLDTIPPPTYQCENGHLICIRCRAKSERCPVCRLRFASARSLVSDQVYNALLDAFNLKDTDEAKSKMQQIFKIPAKEKKLIPDIKITHSHTNKFLARLTGKSSSVDNLSRLSPASSTNFGGGLKTKSLSNQEIFQAESPVISRAGSTSRLNRNERNKFLELDKGCSIAFHGSFETLAGKIEDGGYTESQCKDEDLFHCPFAPNCSFLMKGRNIWEHFQQSHAGPLIQYFKPNLTVKLKKVLKHKDICYVVQYDGNTFFIKLELFNDNRSINQIETSKNVKNILLWTWLLGSKKAAKEYDMQVKVINVNLNDVILCVRSAVCSLNSTTYQDIVDMRKGVYLNIKTFEAIPPKDISLEIILNKSDYD